VEFSLEYASLGPATRHHSRLRSPGIRKRAPDCIHWACAATRRATLRAGRFDVRFAPGGVEPIGLSWRRIDPAAN